MLDLNMPIMNGYEACKQIQQIYEDYNKTQIGNKDSLYRINSMMCINKSDLELSSQIDRTRFIERKPILIACSAFITS